MIIILLFFLFWSIIIMVHDDIWQGPSFYENNAYNKDGRQQRYSNAFTLASKTVSNRNPSQLCLPTVNRFSFMRNASDAFFYVTLFFTLRNSHRSCQIMDPTNPYLVRIYILVNRIYINFIIKKIQWRVCCYHSSSFILLVL